MKPSPSAAPSTAQAAEIQKFSELADQWWDEDGAHAPLHQMNPARLRYIRDQITQHFTLPADAARPYDGLNILDIGCGGGLVCEPMARLGGTITGLDGDAKAIEVARAHAAEQGLDIHYACEMIEAHDGHYDVILALEIIEHVDDPRAFITAALQRLKPGGLIIFSTLNRTMKSLAFGVVAAEYIIGLVPAGTHEWRKFIKPSELTAMIEENGGQALGISGLAFNPLKKQATLTKSVEINYFLTATQ